MDTLTILEEIVKYLVFIPVVIEVIGLLTLIRKRKENKDSVKKGYVGLHILGILTTLFFAITVWHTYSR